MSEQTIDITKKYRTREGREVVLWSDKGNSFKYPICGAIIADNGLHDLRQWTRTGRYMGFNATCEDDLILVRPRIKGKVVANVYKNPFSVSAWPNKEQADEHAVDGRVACVRIDIDCEEGEGLDGKAQE